MIAFLTYFRQFRKLLHNLSNRKEGGIQSGRFSKLSEQSEDLQTNRKIFETCDMVPKVVGSMDVGQVGHFNSILFARFVLFYVLHFLLVNH